MPEPFDKAASTISTAHYSSYCTVAAKKATLHAPLLSAVLAYIFTSSLNSLSHITSSCQFYS